MKTKELDKLLETCEEEKLHLSGMIQPFGALLAIESDTLIITHISENINEFIDYKSDNLLGKKIKDFFPSWIDFLEKTNNPELKYPYVYQKIKELNLYIKISKTKNKYIIDIQNISKKTFDNNLKKDQHKLFITPNNEKSYINYIDMFMNIVSKSIGFNRVMLYKFQEDWSGKVIAEKTTSDKLGSYLKLIFPASDIPKIARDLYMMNSSRIIAQTEAKNIDIITFEDNVPDLTYSDTRSVSPVHIQYLKNMGVKASFSIPIIVGDELWGLLACHHFKNKLLDPIIKNIAIEQTKLFALGVQNYLAKTKLNYMDTIQYKIDDIINSIIYAPNIEEQIIKNQDSFLNLIQSDGFAMVINEKVIAFGKLPQNESFLAIEETLLSEKENYFICSSISNQIEMNEPYIGPAGVLAIKNKFNERESLRCYWFRNENLQELHWAGNPNKPIIEDAGAIRLSPRRSFERFIEVRQGYCDNFNSLELSTAIKFYNILFKYFNKGRR